MVYDIPDLQYADKRPKETLVFQYNKLTPEEQRLFFFDIHQQNKKMDILKEAFVTTFFSFILNPYTIMLYFIKSISSFKRKRLLKLSEKQLVETFDQLFNLDILEKESIAQEILIRMQRKALVLIFR